MNNVMNITWIFKDFVKQLGLEMNFYLKFHLRRKTFKETVAICRKGGYYSKQHDYIELPDSETMKKGSCFYSEELAPWNGSSINRDTEFEVINDDCLLAAKRLKNDGFNPAVLNMASDSNPGGGVMYGVGAQEENIFRRTNLFLSLFQFAPYAGKYGLEKSKDQYPLDQNFGGVYTPDACVFRGLEKDGYPLLDEYYNLSFIAVPALNRPKKNRIGDIIPKLLPVIKNKIRTIFRIGLHKGHDALVLGAWGCGAFRNPPAHIARLFHEVLEEDEFKNKYRKIVFAILGDRNSGWSYNPEGNLVPFQREFEQNPVS